MPKGPKGEKRPADVIGAAVKVMQIATGEIEGGINQGHYVSHIPELARVTSSGGLKRSMAKKNNPRGNEKRAAGRSFGLKFHSLQGHVPASRSKSDKILS